MAWKDIDISLDRQHDGDIKSNLDIDAVINSITNIFKTMQGSRRMVPSFAMPIHNLLFNQIDTIMLSQLESLLLNAISRWEDRIYVINLTSTADTDNNRVNVHLQFRLKSDLEDRVFNINETIVMR